MRLKNNLPHMKNAKVNVCGTSYPIDSDGIADVSEEHADLLLRNSAWQRVITRSPVVVKEVTVKEETPKPIEAKPVIDYHKMKRPELMKLLKYKDIDFSTTMKKSELIELLERGN